MKQPKRTPVDRKRPIQFYATPADRAKIEASAKRAGLTMSNYLRTLALGRKPIFDRPALDSIETLATINRQQTELIGYLSLTPGRRDQHYRLKQIFDMQAVLIAAAKKVRT